MTQYVYLVNKSSGGTLDVVGVVLEPKSRPVLDFLDDFAEKAGVVTDERLSLNDTGAVHSMAGRLIPAAKITEQALSEALGRVSSVRNPLVECLRTLAEQPSALFGKQPSSKKNWNIFRELLDLRALLLQARSKSSFFIALCHD